MVYGSIDVSIGDVFLHYKYFLGKSENCKYRVTGIAGNASGDMYNNRWIVYEPLNDSKTSSLHLDSNKITCYIRPFEEFFEIVNVDGCNFPRFTKSNSAYSIS